MRPGAYNTEDVWSLSLWSWMIYFLLASVSLSMKCEKKILSRWMFLKTLTNPMKHYIIANYYGRMRIQNKRKSFASDSKLKGQRMNICHCPLPTHHEISKWESLPDKCRSLGLYCSSVSSFRSMALHPWLPMNSKWGSWLVLKFALELFQNKQTKNLFFVCSSLEVIMDCQSNIANYFAQWYNRFF